MMLSPHFSLEELTASEVAARVGISNAPPPDVMSNLVRLAEGLELVRAALGNNAVHVTSGYRSPRLNQMVGGSRHSMHMQGLAADILCPVFGPPLEVCRAIPRSSVPADQVIHQMQQYGDTVPDDAKRCVPRSNNPKCYEEDHLISLQP